FLFALAAMAISLGDAVSKPSSTGFKVGEPFPDLVLPSLADGKPLSLARFRGQKVILQIFASW
ncbi:MAG: TlpA family protein disulfide reductase, partial [Acidobacteria bacterium]|nr:TlpA family protein disulfide reductase [Acidobacteriota bacterium]